MHGHTGFIEKYSMPFQEQRQSIVKSVHLRPDIALQLTNEH